MAEPVASFHLVRQHAARAPLVLPRLVLERRRLVRTPGLRFFRLLGTGRGRTTSLSVDPARYALFAVWDDEASLAVFLGTSPVAARWRRAAEHYSVQLRLIGGGGRWHGAEPLARLPRHPAPTGAVAVLTRADVRVRAWRRFLTAGRPVSNALAHAPGLLAVAGVGEAPLGRQATFSLWRDASVLETFAYGDPTHVEVVRRTRSEGWYGDELFARFAPVTLEGTWDGVDPLSATTAR